MNFIINIRNWYYQHRIEAFGLAVFLCLSLLLTDIAFIKYSKIKHDEQYEMTNGVYVSNFTSSLSGQNGNIKSIYRSTDGTKLAIMLEFENVAKMIQDATEYQIFFKGYDLTNERYARKNLNDPSGGYVIFKNAGISMIYLYDANGFQSQATEIVVRCNKDLTKSNQNSETTKELATQSKQYAENDMFRLMINPAGQNIKISTALDSLNFDATNLYRDTFLAKDETEIRKQLKADINNMYTQLIRINEYRQLLVDMKVAVPEYHEYIYGDTFEPLENSVISDVLPTYTYQPAKIMDGGVAYPWWAFNLTTNSFLANKPESVAVYDDQSFLDALGSDTEYILPNAEDFNENQVLMVNGEFLKLDEDSEISNTAIISKNVREYIMACNQYLLIKRDYLCNHIKSYIVLEYNLKTTGNDYSINLQPETIDVW